MSEGCCVASGCAMFWFWFDAQVSSGSVHFAFVAFKQFSQDQPFVLLRFAYRSAHYHQS